MIAVSLLPLATVTARLVAGLAGNEWLEFDAALAPAMDLKLTPEATPFPTKGTVSIRRGFDHVASGERSADALRYIAASSDSETGAAVAERFGVTLFMDEAAFDRLLARVGWGLPEVDLFFDAGSQVIARRSGGKPEHLQFRASPQPWERIASVKLTQRPRA